MTRDLTRGKPLRLVLSFAAPLLFGVLFQQLYSFVDTAIVGKFLGAEKLAAVGATGSLNFLVIGLCLGFCSGFAIPVAQAFGARDEAGLHKAVAHAVMLSALLSAVFAVAAALLCRPILQAMGTPPEILEDAARYIRVIFAAIPCCVLYNMTGGIMRSLGDSRTPVLFLVGASLLNIVLDLVLILWAGMDVAGAAVATAVSQLAAGLGCAAVLRRRLPGLRLRGIHRSFEPATALHMLGVGLPMGLQYSITAIGSVMVQASVNGLGVDAVAAVSASSKLSACFACVYDALATTMATYAGQNTGARKLDRISRGLGAAAVAGTVWSLLALGCVALFARPLLGLFVNPGDGDAVLDMGSRYLLINASFYVPLLLVNIVRLSIQGMGFTRVAMLAGLTEMIARTGVALLLVPRLGFTGACFANPAAWVLADCFLIPCYFHVLRGLQSRLLPDAETAPRRRLLRLSRKKAA